jgi:S-disulfanyl-L-cysteine oxidoreductase SoxD
MSSSKFVLSALAGACMLGGYVVVAGATGYPVKYDFGAPASDDEIKAIDIDIMPDGRGLPPGRGTYAQGKALYADACAACHGADLKGVDGLPDPLPSTRVSLHLIGGRGSLTTNRPVLTVESYWPYASTLFDYIRRAMPFTAPGSLTNDEVYALTAYILGEAKIIDPGMVMDAQTLPKVEMPNKDGFVPDTRPELFR